ncbi:hypothetical protein D3C80_1746820 [compost metagenome]
MNPGLLHPQQDIAQVLAGRILWNIVDKRLPAGCPAGGDARKHLFGVYIAGIPAAAISS